MVSAVHTTFVAGGIVIQATATAARSVMSFTVRFHHPKVRAFRNESVNVKAVGGAAVAVVRVAAKTQDGTFTARTEVSLVKLRCRKSQGVRNVDESPGRQMSSTGKASGLSRI